MSTLGGDNFLNKWSVPLIPCVKLVTVKQQQYEELFDTVEKASLADDMDADSCQQTADELVLGKEDVVPFPHEYDMALGMGMLDTFAWGSCSKPCCASRSMASRSVPRKLRGT